MPASLYFHVPFCSHRCAYCDFNTYAGQEEAIPAYVEALCEEIRAVGDAAPDKHVGTIFFGGGTPSLLRGEQFRKIFESIRRYFEVVPGAETSLEANPGTVTAESLGELRSIGFNRISYGVQSTNPEELRMLERIHSYEDVIDAFTWSRRAGFDNLNFDLIYGLPEQTLERWQQSVRLVSELKPEHISAYALTLEHGTPFGRWAARGLLPIPDPDLAASQYEWAAEFLAGKGYEQYEISNWSFPGRQCRHNLQYWRNLDYLGLGAGAHGYASGCRYSNVLRIKTYIERLKQDSTGGLPYPLSPAAVNQHWNSPRDDMQETMMTGLRLTQEGVSGRGFRERFGVEIGEAFGKEIGQLVKLGLLEWADDRLCLTVRGRLLGNQVFMEFVG
ncbi:MAG TPA: radical SAM family heme chaperone HemW [Anaerolineales bacterium]|jgi:oxygen-independent coproporphyrinogen-3 oxidase